MVKLIRFTALLLAAVFTAEAQAAFFPQTTVTQSLGTNLHVNVDSAPSTTVSGTITANQGGTWNLGINTALPAGANVIGGVTQSGGPWTENQTQVGGAAITLGAKTSALSYPVVLASDQAAIPTKGVVNSTGSFVQNAAITTTAATLTAPANATGFILQNDSASSDCVRWKIGSAATATTGLILFPTDATPEVHSGANVSVASCSGTQTVNIQWISQ